jgi:AcrR family transcriptional regulator
MRDVRDVPGAIGEKLLAAADELGFRFTRVSMDEIARISGVPRATIYYYFSGRDELLVHVTSLALTELATEAQEVVAGPGTAVERLRGVERCNLHHLHNHRAASELLFAYLGTAGLHDVTARIKAGIDPTRQLTVTGGMTFAGGPLNSYVLHSTAAMASVLRADPGATALVTSVSGFLTKYGAAVWSTEPPSRRWEGADVTAEAAESSAPRPDASAHDLAGPLTVVGATVALARDGARTLFAVAEAEDGTRTVVRSDDDAVIERGRVGERL